VGGKVSKEGDWLFLVSILYDNTHKCGGSFINNEWILTARHCIDKLKKKEYLYFYTM
jgi:secreted trypsin-like serine protease